MAGAAAGFAIGVAAGLFSLCPHPTTKSGRIIADQIAVVGIRKHIAMSVTPLSDIVDL